MGFEGANVLFDSWVHPLMMGLEEHLLGMFKEDFEFYDGAAPSHLGKAGVASPPLQPVAPRMAEVVAPAAAEPANAAQGLPAWTSEAEKELGKIPFFVRGKARRNTERFAQQSGLHTITVETLYDAKAHFGR